LAALALEEPARERKRAMSATAKEWRERAKSCLERAETTNEYYAKDAIVEMARNLIRVARQEERREEQGKTLKRSEGNDA
jgi:hypothetical protein